MAKKLSRRAFLQVSTQTTLLAGLVMAGCGDSQDFALTNPQPNPAPAPRSLEVLSESTLVFEGDTAYRLDFLGHTVARLSPTREVVWQVGDLGSGDGIFNFPVALDVDSTGRIYVADRGNGEVDVLDGDGNLVATFGQDLLLSARDLAVDSTQDLIYVCDAPAHRVVVFDRQGNVVRTLGELGDTGFQMNFPSGVAVASDGKVHVVDSGNAEVQVHGADGNYLFSYGGPGTELGQFNVPRSVVIDSLGNSYVADGVAGFITRFDPKGQAIERFQPTRADGLTISPQYLNIGPADLLIVTGTPVFQPPA